MKTTKSNDNQLQEKLIASAPPRLSFVSVIIQLSTQIWVSRSLVRHLFLRDFNAQFRQRALGYLWIIIEPMIAVFGFVLMDHAGVLDPGSVNLPYPLYVLVGTTLWVSITNSLTAVANSLQKQSDLILRTNTPKISLAISGLGQVLFKSVIQYFTILVSFIIFGADIITSAIVYLPAIIPLVLFGTGLGLILSIFAVIAKDVTRIFTTFFSILMYATPVIYLSENIESPTLQKLIYWNPLSWLIEMPRTLLITTEFNYWPNWLISVVFCILVFFIGLYIFYLLEDKVAERL